MTQNQVHYAQVLEDRRHNRASEKETNRSNIAKEVETYRHNRIAEEIDLAQQSIVREHYERSDTATILYNQGQLELNRVRNAETARHNAADELINSSKASETSRHNVVSEQLETEVVAKQTSNMTLNTILKGILDIGKAAVGIAAK